MQEHKGIYNSFIPNKIKLPLLVLAMFPHLMLMSLFNANSTFSASYLEIEPEDIQFFLSLMYGTVIVTLLIFDRFFSFFRLKSYMILMNTGSILSLLLLSISKDYITIANIRILNGFFGVLEGACFLPLIIKELKTSHARLIGYLFLYAIMLTGGTFTASILKFTITSFGFKEMIYVVILFHVFVISLVLLLFNNNRIVAKYPLYQLDYVSCFFLLIAMHCGAYLVIFGRKLYWFNSSHIVICFTLFLVFSGLFILKNVFAKRPLFNFTVLKYKNVIIGILLFIIFYTIRGGLSLVYNIMSTVWKWPWEYVIKIQYFNVIGTIIGVIGSGYFLIRGIAYKEIIAIGFFILAIDCIWFTFLFYPDTTIKNLFGPLFTQGFAQGWLFTPIVMYMSGNLPAKLIGNATLMGTTTRFWFTNISFAIMQNCSYFLNWKHFINLSANLVESNPIVNESYQAMLAQDSQSAYPNFIQSLAHGKLFSMLSLQATLLSAKEIFTVLSLVAFATFILILTIKPSRFLFSKIKKSKFIKLGFPI